MMRRRKKRRWPGREIFAIIASRDFKKGGAPEVPSAKLHCASSPAGNPSDDAQTFGNFSSNRWENLSPVFFSCIEEPLRRENVL